MIYYNRASERLDNLKRESVVGRHVLDSFNLNEDTSLILQVIKKKKPLIDVNQDYVTTSGYRVVCVSSVFPLFRKNIFIGVLAVTKDITKFKKLLSVINQSSKQNIGKDYGDKADCTFDKIVGQSEILNNCIETAKLASKTNSPVMLYGDTGTGKELFAQSIHNSSGLSGPFMPINCAAIPENLLESILFGTVKGAFTGATDRAGLFEESAKGTLLLDELNSMSLGLQAKILRAIIRLCTE